MLRIQRTLARRPVMGMLVWAARRFVICSFAILMFPPPAGKAQQCDYCNVSPCSGLSGKIISYGCSTDRGQINCCVDPPCVTSTDASCAGCGQCFYYDSCDDVWVLIGSPCGGEGG